MQTSRLILSTLTAIGIVGLSGWAVAQTTTTTPNQGVTTTPGMNNTTPGMTNTTPGVTITTPSATTTETTAQRMERERMERERMAAPGTTGNTAPRDSNGNLVARADRN